MLATTLGQLLINEALPASKRDYNRVLTKKSLGELVDQIAEESPEDYPAIAKRLSDVGREAAYTSGGQSFGLRHIKQTAAGQIATHELRRKLDTIYARQDLSDDSRDDLIRSTVGAVRAKLVADVEREASDTDNPLARQLKGTGRGNPSQLNSLLGADLLYTDQDGTEIPIPVLRSYGQGLSPLEYFAGSFGARKGIIDLKDATADAGFLAKQLTQATHRLVVTDKDDDNPYDEQTPRGLPASTSDPDNAGALLAHPIGGYARNTELTPKVLKDLRGRGVDDILVRSPVVGGPRNGGVYGYDVGRRERQRIAPRGDYVGITAAQALAEPITQSQISSKHSGGVSGAGAGAISGFKAINALVQVPKVYPSGAAHAQRDGKVDAVEAAPQGGHFVWIGGEQHYVNPSLGLKVRPGDTIEAGDVLSSGIPSPSEVVKHKGIGEGRRYFVKAFQQTLRDSGTPAHGRNVQLLGRGLINHIRLTDEVGDYMPDDVVPYQLVERDWKPRDGASVLSPRAAVGRYLERPVLHYTVGDKIRPSMLADFGKFGVNAITVHNDPPPWQPEMIRGMANVSHDPEWFPRMLGGGQQRSLLTAVHRGLSSDEDSTSFVPALARGVDFGKTEHTRGWSIFDNDTPAKPVAGLAPRPLPGL